MVRVQREKIRSGRKKDKRFEGENAVLAEGVRLNSAGRQAGGVRGKSHSVGRCGISR